MQHFFTPIITNIEAIIAHGGYTVLFLISVLEGLPIIGQFIPGHTIVILSGFLAKVSVLNIYIIVPLVIAGAMLGDVIAYSLGKKYGFVFITRFGKYLFIKEEHIEKVKQLIHSHIGKTVILGRFSPITRPLAPFAVGASGISFNKFWPLAFLGVTMWSTISIGIGYIFGASYHIVAGVLGKYIVIAIIIGLLISWAYYFVNKQFHIFAKYELITLGANLFGLYIFSKTIQDTLSNHSFMTELDVWINIYLSHHVNSFWVKVMIFITDTLGPSSLTIAGFFGIAYFIYKKHWRYSVITFLSLGAGLAISDFMKGIVMRIRPHDALAAASGFSFPSGHAVAATIFFTLVIYFFARKIKPIVWRELSIVACVLLILLVAFSRLYLNVHWFSDVVAGIGFGLFWTTLMILLVRYVGIVYTKFKDSNIV